MVTPENGSITLRGASGKYYNINLYSSDVLGAAVTMSLVGLAGTSSQNFYILPENCVVVDLSVTTGQTVTTNWSFYINDQPIGNVVPIANIVNTLNQRAVPHIPLPGNRKLTIIQA